MPKFATSAILSVVLSCIPVATALAQTQPRCGEWLPLTGPDGQGLDGSVRAMATFDGGDGPMLYVGGDFVTAGGQRSPYLARWDGEQWHTVPGLDSPGSELDAFVRTLYVWDDGAGPALYVGGGFTMAAGLLVNHVARFDGAEWSALAGPDGIGTNDRLSELHAHDDGSGEALYASGSFIEAGGAAANRVARWDGSAWSAVGDGGDINTPVIGLETYQGDLHAALTYLSGGARRVPGVARWDGETWSRLSGPDETYWTEQVWPLTAWDDGDGERLYAGGSFTMSRMGENFAYNFAWWDGQQWDGIDFSTFLASQVTDILPFDDGDGEKLYVSGRYRSPTGRLLAVGRIVDGRGQDLQNAPNPVGRVLGVFDAGDGPALHVGGDFPTLLGLPGGTQPGYIARWRPRRACPADVNGDCAINLSDFLEFQNLFAAGDDRADFDGDGQLTIFDFLAFHNAFDAGCP